MNWEADNGSHGRRKEERGEGGGRSSVDRRCFGSRGQVSTSSWLPWWSGVASVGALSRFFLSFCWFSAASSPFATGPVEVERFSPALSMWTPVPPMCSLFGESRVSHALALRREVRRGCHLSAVSLLEVADVTANDFRFTPMGGLFVLVLCRVRPITGDPS